MFVHVAVFVVVVMNFLLFYDNYVGSVNVLGEPAESFPVTLSLQD